MGPAITNHSSPEISRFEFKVALLIDEREQGRGNERWGAAIANLSDESRNIKMKKEERSSYMEDCYKN
ncbi:hypothetical protein L6452_06606 [Arctium lappa]|uniref:Uncharacterized protein n=1 Tax=Arctium lappa TaxID=4217 RepID=A0ACB9EKC3_ARCLA|nr:hypothetical protein L6452_06606 [Arctium lappa]